MRNRQGKARVALGVFGEFRRIGRFQPHVLFAGDGGFEMAHHVARAQTAAAGRQELDDASGEMERVDVAAKGGGDAGAQHLDRHLSARFAHPRAVNLGNGGRRHGFGKFGKQLIDRLAQVGQDDVLGDVRGKGRQAVLQHPQLVRHLDAHHIRARGQDLAELDIGGAKRGDCPGDRRQVRIALVAQPAERPAHHARRDTQAGRRINRVQDRAHGAGAFECGAGADQAQKVVRPSQSFQPECSAAIPIERLRYCTRPKPAARIMSANASWSGNLRIDSTRY